MLEDLIRHTESQIALKRSQLNEQQFDNEVAVFREANTGKFRKEGKRKMAHKTLLKKIGRDVKEILAALQTS